LLKLVLDISLGLPLLFLEEFFTLEKGLEAVTQIEVEQGCRYHDIKPTLDGLYLGQLGWVADEPRQECVGKVNPQAGKDSVKDGGADCRAPV